MALRQIVISDISGNDVPDDQHARLVITDHPALQGGSVELDVSTSEARKVQTSKIDLVSVDVYEPDKPRRTVVLEASAFNDLFQQVDMDEVIANARKVTSTTSKPRRSSNNSSSGPGSASVKIDYSSIDWAGTPHRGRITEAERTTVQNHLAAVNKKLEAKGMRLVDPANAEHQSKYGIRPA